MAENSKDAINFTQKDGNISEAHQVSTSNLKKAVSSKSIRNSQPKQTFYKKLILIVRWTNRLRTIGRRLGSHLDL
jgi:hypothetical protein